MRNSPNFFIVGGPKCGTTAMTEFLRTHEDIFISEPKEPNFFADMPKIKFVDNLKDYLNLFKKATKKKIIGDASIFYMFSKVALENIHEFNPDSKILVMIRNPLEMVPSFHLQILFTLEEDQEDFESALALEEKRKKGDRIPKYSRAPELLNYSEIAKYGDQIENIYKFFPKEQVKVILFDDFKKNNRETYVETLEFLGLNDDGRTEFPRVNDAKKPKSKIINKIISRPPKFAKVIAKGLRKVLNKPRLGIVSRLSHMNREKVDRQPLSKEVKARLLEIYKEDILKTEKIINKDLSGWLS